MENKLPIYITGILTVLLALAGHVAWGQQPTRPQGGNLQEGQIELLKAGRLEGRGKVRYIRPDANTPRVVFRRDSSLLYCDLAIQNVEDRSVNAYGDILIEEGGGAIITADTLYYDNDTNIAELLGNVIMRDSTTTVRTDHFYYNLTTRNGYYLDSGQVEEDGNILTSKKGYYYAARQVLAFKENVDMYDPEADRTLLTDSLTYFTTTKTAFFHDTTTIITPDGELVAKEGSYNTVTETTSFEGNAFMESEKYTLRGERMYRNKINDTNIVEGDVELFAKEDRVTVYGDKMWYKETYGNSKVYGDPGNTALMKRPFGQNDTIFIMADTLYTINDTINNIRQLHAYYQVLIYSNSLQGKCDSLIYDYNDSTITMFVDPLLWNDDNQISADHIQAYVSNNNIDSLRLTTRSFVIQQDTMGNYNQIKGRDMLAHFEGRDITQLDVNGNGETLYFLLEQDTLTMGMNRVECSEMTMVFGDSSKLKTMTFRTQVDAKFIPVHEIKEPEKRLKDFRLRFDERPQKAMIVARKQILAPMEEEAPPPARQKLPSQLKEGLSIPINTEKGPTKLPDKVKKP